MTINYEALGRYVAAEETVTALLHKQGQLVTQMDNILIQTKQNYSVTNTIRIVETVKLIELSTALNQAQNDLLDAVREANHYADTASKPKLHIKE